LLWLALRKVLAQRVRPTYDWRPVMSQFAVLFGTRFTRSEA
jgi:transposase-like protein